MEIFFLLTLAHLLTDYPLQTNWVYQQKTRGFMSGIYHSGTLLLSHLLLLFPYLGDTRISIALIGIAALHHVQDYIKVELFDNKGRLILFGYVLDQVMHFTIFALLAWATSSYFMPLPVANMDYVFWYHDPLFSGYFILLIMATFGWEITAFVRRRDKDASLIFHRNYPRMAMRGLLLTIGYIAYLYFVKDSLLVLFL